MNSKDTTSHKINVLSSDIAKLVSDSQREMCDTISFALSNSVHREISESIDRLCYSVSQSISSDILDMAKSFTELFNNFCEQISAQIADSMNFSKLAEEFIADFKASLLRPCFSIDCYNVFRDISESITVNQCNVEISNEALKSLYDSFDFPSEYSSEPTSVCSKTTAFSIKDFFILIIIPILSVIAPMVQTYYLHSLDALESRKESISNESYQEQLLRIEAEQNESIQILIDYCHQLSYRLDLLEENEQLSNEQCCTHQQDQSVDESPSPDSESSALAED